MYLQGHVKGKAAFTSRFRVASEHATGECVCCGWPTRRSYVTKILHDDCYLCRKLKMVYGPNISVRRYGRKKS